MREARRRVRREHPPRKEAGHREDGAKKASAVKLLWQSSGPRIAYRHNDTCVGYASQRRTPRPREWGEARKIPMERLCQPPSEPAFVLYREQPNTAPLNGAKFVVNASHRETHFLLEIRLTVRHILQRRKLDKYPMPNSHSIYGGDKYGAKSKI